MLRIKLARKGRKKRPFFRILVLEQSKDPFGDYLENVGHLDPQTKNIVLNEERIKYWISQGAQPTDSVHNILVEKGILKKKKKNVSALGKKKKLEIAEQKEKEEKEKKAKAEAKKAKLEKFKHEEAESQDTKTEETKPEETKPEEK